jgi:NAD(P)-dependent dehydrogenase (short-subunit alcohol dehydrogenase family)
VVVTGAASGIGAACAARLGDAYRVIGVDLHETEVTADLGTVEGRGATVSAVADLCGGALSGLQPLLVEGGAGGSAVAISSNSTTVQPAIPEAVVEACLAHDETRARALADEAGSMVTYPATKLALAHWVRRQGTGPDWAGAGLRLNAIAPGMIDTPMVGDMRADPQVGPLLDMLPIPIGRPGRPEEIAALVALLLGPDGGYFCGSVLFCDGGSDALLRASDWPAAWDISVRDLGRKLR